MEHDVVTRAKGIQDRHIKESPKRKAGANAHNYGVITPYVKRVKKGKGDYMGNLFGKRYGEQTQGSTKRVQMVLTGKHCGRTSITVKKRVRQLRHGE